MRTWRERVCQESFSLEDLTLAARWNTCAVGEQRQIHPLVIECSRSCPNDQKLWILGNGFVLAVQENNPSRASIILDAIEDRVLELKRNKTVD